MNYEELSGHFLARDSFDLAQVYATLALVEEQRRTADALEQIAKALPALTMAVGAS